MDDWSLRNPVDRQCAASTFRIESRSQLNCRTQAIKAAEGTGDQDLTGALIFREWRPNGQHQKDNFRFRS